MSIQWVSTSGRPEYSVGSKTAILCSAVVASASVDRTFLSPYLASVSGSRQTHFTPPLETSQHRLLADSWSPSQAILVLETMAENPPLVALFGYDTSTFTLKVRLALRLKQIPYTFVPVPTMMPRPLLRDNFHLTYRKIPVLAIGREIYCDTSIITEALEYFFPEAEGYGSLYPKVLVNLRLPSALRH